MRVVFLVGFMGAGKSSVGLLLSRDLDWRFEDLDERIQSREGRSIEQIFRASGEAGFRTAEHAALRELLLELDASAAVVALGGGAFAQPENAALLSGVGAKTVFLDAEADELRRRCLEDGTERPLLRDKAHFRQLYETRRTSYLGATLRIETGGKDVETVVEEVKLRLGLKSSR
jgi:shikimate kinase